MQNSKLFLEGTWRGVARVIDNVEYEEEVEFTKIKPDVYFYQEKIIHTEKGPSHFETGYLRVFREHNTTEGKLELAVAFPFGVCEIAEGTFTENKATLKTESVVETSSAIEPYVSKFSREYALKDADTLTYSFKMTAKKSAAGETEELPGVEGELKRVK